jgi:hypothetical protein
MRDTGTGIVPFDTSGTCSGQEGWLIPFRGILDIGYQRTFMRYEWATRSP